MNLLNSFTGGGGDEKPSGAGAGTGGGIAKHSSSELMASAKVVADAAKRASSEGVDKVDKEKAAGAASDLLDAGSDYGKLTEKGYGKYVDQAQDYLHKFGGKPGAEHPKPSDHPADQEKPAAPSDHHDDDEKKKKTEEKSDGGGLGGFAKTAQGFF